jgi:deoxyadenosine/deoxycytidine kinase/NTP pyrophosphatase (non-canonical NTP hydrolase)
MARHPYIAIEGVIGVGKTTLARLLQPELSGTVLFEEFEENPFLSDFYSDRTRYAFQTQIFFLLSRYRQQITALPRALRQSAVVSDYTFAKDSLFAHLNLSGDELMMYERVYAALGEKIPKPDLLVFLRADLSVLLGRIAARDRPYERDMDAGYIDRLRLAYEEFVRTYTDAPVLVIDTNRLNIVQSAEDRAYAIGRVKSSLEYGTYQAELPGVGPSTVREPEVILEELEESPHRLVDFQHFHISLDARKGFDPDPFFNFIAMTEEIGELARVLKFMWGRQSQYLVEGRSAEEAHRLAVLEYRERIEDELADSLAYLLKLSNYAGIDLEKAYLAKMAVNAQRRWEDQRAVEEGE